MTTATPRNTDLPISSDFIDRWSPRSFNPVSMPDEDLMTILEAARFAPSAMNLQPWRFIYAHRNTPEWEKLIPVLFDSNASWAKNASALVLLFSQLSAKNVETGEEKPIGTHSFDAGAAWMSLALQSHKLGYHSHAMGGVHKDKALEIFNIPSSFRLEVGIAIGKRGDISALPDALQRREMPSPRKALSELAGNGVFVE